MDPDALGQGFVVAGFSIEGLLGRGSFGSVYRARRNADGVWVALKVMHARVLASTGGAERFAREAELARRLDHPNVVRVLAAGEDRGLLFTALELLEGESLEDRIARGPTPPQEVAFIGDGVLAGLDAAHLAGVLHRDIKPANLFLCAPEGVKILDFGVAKSTNPNTAAGLTQDGLALGTPAYMAPEHLAGVGLGPACDVFAVGLVLAEMMLGRTIYPAQTSALDILRERLSGARPPIPAQLLASPLGAVIEAATRPDPSMRTATASEMRRALAAAATKLPVPPRDRPRTGVIVRPKPVYATLELRAATPVAAPSAQPIGLGVSALAASVGAVRPEGQSVAIAGGTAAPQPVVAVVPKAPPAPSRRGLVALLGLGAAALVGGGGALILGRGKGAAPTSDSDSDAEEEPRTAKKRPVSSASAAASNPSGSAVPASSAKPPAADAPFVPLPLAVGQWVRMRINNDGKTSRAEYRLVGKEADGMWILEVDNETTNGPITMEMILDFADRKQVDSIRIRSARVKTGGKIINLPASTVQGMLKGMGPNLVLPEFDPKKRSDVTVSAGTFQACYIGFSKGEVMGMKFEQTTFNHPSVPINALVKGEGTLNGKPSTTELLEFGLQGAKASM